ncbi:M10 family metallopeptidase domain-containing protein [Pseudomarimonas salicorniae]|uniref:M10 family metallopeptidase domain-containing protein n=1 Tax=Pseudomarimonas salicorniae TaxID=2933270 RepID=A0ABT0GJF6_9GAMM|nr:M10 family metallopeptidase domain-containing protein [Lysobacter sp. CAU 1642]MCK7594344.1 M10 family metallopeptidase domain-containing protein [Lysobacter sp. CAU 1642]
MMRKEAKMLTSSCKWAVVLMAAAVTVPATAGVYLGQRDRPIHAGYAYQGVGGRVDIPLCPSEALHTATRNVAAKFNRRSNGLGNIAQFGDPEFPPSGAFSVESVLLHELGHAVGLGHPSEEVVAAGGQAQHTGIAPSNWGMNGSLDAEPGPDGVYGSEDDLRGDDVSLTPFPLSGNNSPFAVPSIVDDLEMTSDRARRVRPGTWPLVPWVGVSRLLGLPDTQSVMMTVVPQVTTRLSPDELTLLKWLESGADGVASSEDDYDLFFYVVAPSAPANERPPNCLTVSMVSLSSSALAQTRYLVPWLESAVYTCFGSKLCVRQSAIEFNTRYTWHYPATDTSNGEADYVPLAAPDVVFTAPSQIEVNQGVAEEVAFQVARQGGEAFPAGTQLSLTHSNGVVSCASSEGRCATQFDLGGKTVFNATVTVDGDGTPSSGAIFINVFMPNRDVARGRITVVDLAETLVLDFVPSRVQLRTTGLPNIANSEPYTTEQWVARLRTSSSNTPVQGAVIRGDISYSQGPGDLNFCRNTRRQGIADRAIFRRDDTTDAMGGARFELEYGADGSGDPVQYEALCRYLYEPTSGPQIEGFMTITTDQVLASLTPDRTQVTLRTVMNGQQEAFAFSTLDQLGQPLAQGRELTASCDAPAGNQVQFTPVLPVAVDGSGVATLTVEASTAGGEAFVDQVTCSVAADGVSRSVTIAPVLPAELVLTPASIFLDAEQQVFGGEIEVYVRVNDAFGDAMPGVPVILTCPAPTGPDAAQLVPVLPTTRQTEGDGTVRMSAAFAHVGRLGLATPIDCTVRAAPQSALFRVEGQPFRIFLGGFEAP